MRFNRAVRCGDGHASEHEAGTDLVLVEKSLIGLVDTAADSFPAQEEQEPARQDTGKSMSESAAASRIDWSSAQSMVRFSPSLALMRVTLYVAMTCGEQRNGSRPR